MAYRRQEITLLSTFFFSLSRLSLIDSSLFFSSFSFFFSNRSNVRSSIYTSSSLPQALSINSLSLRFSLFSLSLSFTTRRCLVICHMKIGIDRQCAHEKSEEQERESFSHRSCPKIINKKEPRWKISFLSLSYSFGLVNGEEIILSKF